MAFTGTAVVTQVSDNMIRITGLSLATTVSGTIGLFGHTGSTPGVTLPEQFKTEHYTYLGKPVTLQDQIQVTVVPTTGVSSAQPIRIVKTGSSVADFLITLTNDGGATSPTQEIYIKNHT